eukprot:jgi/Ulvmu1/7539/UM037_0083.1
MKSQDVPLMSRKQGSRPKASLRRETADRKPDGSSGQGVQELRSVNIALAEQLAQERAEHEKDVAEANATIKQLHAALSQTRGQLDATEQEQNQRVHGVAASLRGLQEKLRLQEETKTSSEARAQQLAAFVLELRKQTECLHVHVKDRDTQLSVLRAENDNACKALTELKVSEKTACVRLEKLEIELSQSRTDAASSSTLVQQLKTSLAAAQHDLELLRLNEKKFSEDVIKLKDKAMKISSECVQLRHLLETEKRLHGKAQEDLSAAREENKDLISRSADMRALASSIEELKAQCRKIQGERDAMEACMVGRAQELESLTAENARLKSDWKLREDGLSSSHEIRIQHLMKSLQEREQQNCDLHNSLHKTKVQTENARAELETQRLQAEKASEAITSLDQRCSDLMSQLDEEKNINRQLRADASDAQREHSSKLAQCDAELSKTQQTCRELQARVESLLLQMQSQIAAHSSLKLKLEDAERNSSEQVSKLTSSIRELSDKLLGCQRQHDKDSACSESTIQQLHSKLNGVTSEAAIVKAALETAALENESSQNEIKQLRKDLDVRSRDNAATKAQLKDCTAQAEALQSAQRQKQGELESAMHRQEQMLKAVTNAMNVEEQAKLTAQKQLRTAKDRAAKLDQELTDVMGKLADANEHVRDMQAERDDALDNVQVLRRKLDFQRRQDQADRVALARKPHDTWLRKSSKVLGMGSPEHVLSRTAHSAAGELYRPPLSSAAHGPDEASSYQQRLAEIRARE